MLIPIHSMKRTAVIFSLIFCLLGVLAPQAEAQAVRSPNTVYKFFTTYTGTTDSTRVTDTGSGSLVCKSWVGAAEGVAIQVNIKKVSGSIGSFKGYFYSSNDGTNFGTTPLDSIVVTNTTGTKTYMIHPSTPAKYHAPYFKFTLQGVGTGVATATYVSIIGKK